MKAQPLKFEHGAYAPCDSGEATHVMLAAPGPFPNRLIPVQTSGTRKDTGNWTWNGDTEKPTLRPSVLTRGTKDLTDEEIETIQAGGTVTPVPVVCHSWITDGKIQFLGDCTHELAGQTLDLLDVEGAQA